MSGEGVLRYGGDTSCYVIESAGQRCIIDAGTGLARFAREGEQLLAPTTMFLSHYHLASAHTHCLINFLNNSQRAWLLRFGFGLPKQDANYTQSLKLGKLFFCWF